MIYTLQIKCVWGMYLQAPFERTVEIDEKTSLLKLHGYLQKLTGFANDHCFDFFVGRNPQDMKRSLGEPNGLDGGDDPVATLEAITLADVFPLEKNHFLFYWFDFGDDWRFRISRKRTAEPQPGVKYPRVTAEVGPKPKQYPRGR